jgi:hypothetical protein
MSSGLIIEKPSLNEFEFFVWTRAKSPLELPARSYLAPRPTAPYPLLYEQHSSRVKSLSAKSIAPNGQPMGFFARLEKHILRND